MADRPPSFLHRACRSLPRIRFLGFRKAPSGGFHVANRKQMETATLKAKPNSSPGSAATRTRPRRIHASTGVPIWVLQARQHSIRDRRSGQRTLSDPNMGVPSARVRSMRGARVALNGFFGHVTSDPTRLGFIGPGNRCSKQRRTRKGRGDSVKRKNYRDLSEVM